MLRDSSNGDDLLNPHFADGRKRSGRKVLSTLIEPSSKAARSPLRATCA